MLPLVRILSFALLAGSSPASAQFASLSTTDDGSILFFTTPLSQAGSGQPNHGKVFILDSRGLRPLLARERTETVVSFIGQPAYTTNFYDFVGVSTAGDMSQLAIAGLRECSGYTGGLCSMPDSTDVYNARGEYILTVGGHMTVSRNGKWGLVVEDPFSGGFRFVVIDLTTLREYPGSAAMDRPRALNWGRRSIADDGTAVIAGEHQLWTFRPPDVTRRISESLASSAAIDAGGTTVVWRDNGLRALQLGGSAAQPILLDANGDEPQISSDGTSILYLAPVAGAVQLFLIRPDGSGRVQLTTDVEGIGSAVLSGNGKVVWMVTRRGRLVRLDIDSRARREYTGPVPAVLDVVFYPGRKPAPDTQYAAAGQVVTLPASVGAGDEMTAKLGDLPVPVLGIQNGSITLQVPWEAVADTEYWVTLAGPERPEWTGRGSSLRVEKDYPRLLRAAPEEPLALAAHEKFDGAVTVERPARPGEIVHLYGQAFGPVTPPVKTGAPALANPLSVTVTPVVCFVRKGVDVEVPVTVLFAGLAPLTVGYYQLDVRLPEELRPGVYSVGCAFAGQSIGESVYQVSLPVR